ncbi:hypothetical protein [Acidovorax sp. Root70]|uniref:hypothetical protein n=1 Tax=Acidovorax sp. Root70 TaxID=1736590 RepID=UPI00138F04AB|nr:hypothetical protein [Acidovorax sp. Root70]
MQNDIDHLLNDHLVRWHNWCSRYRFGKGYPSSDVTCRQSRTSKQYDYDNGAIDASVEDSIAEAFDAAMDRVEQPYRTALSIQARNLATGATVWNSPRLPADPMERSKILMDARNILLKVLASTGVMG